MPLSCSCYTGEAEPGWWYYCGASCYDNPDIFIKPPVGRRKRCSSCGNLINHDEDVIEHYRVKVPKTQVEVNIYGEDGEIPIASHWTCEKCSHIYLALDELGYCVSANENMNELLQDYNSEKSDGKTLSTD